MNTPPHIQISSYLVKRAETDPRIIAALLGGGVGAVGGGMVQLVRKLLQSSRDERENGAPSIMRGILTGGLGGAALGAGAEHWAQGAQRLPALPLFGGNASIAAASGFGGAAPPRDSLAALAAGGPALERPEHWAQLPGKDPLRAGLTTPGGLEGSNGLDRDRFLSALTQQFGMNTPSPSSMASGTIPAPSLPPSSMASGTIPAPSLPPYSG